MWKAVARLSTASFRRFTLSNRRSWIISKLQVISRDILFLCSLFPLQIWSSCRIGFLLLVLRSCYHPPDLRATAQFWQRAKYGTTQPFFPFIESYVGNSFFYIDRSGFSFFHQYPKSLCGGLYLIKGVRDLTTGYDSRRPDGKALLPSSSSSQMITFYFENGLVATIRTSGTEPKIKYYTELRASPSNRWNACFALNPFSSFSVTNCFLPPCVNNTVIVSKWRTRWRKWSKLWWMSSCNRHCTISLHARSNSKGWHP